jgi:hypothetical protein
LLLLLLLDNFLWVEKDNHSWFHDVRVRTLCP